MSRLTNTLAALAAAATLSLPVVVGIAANADSPAPRAPQEEDGTGWSCVDDGNHVCGPGNANGVAPGCYDDGGVLEFPWPCTAWRPSYGYLHGDGTITYPNGDVYCPADGEIYASAQDCHNHDMRPAPGAGAPPEPQSSVTLIRCHTVRCRIRHAIGA